MAFPLLYQKLWLFKHFLRKVIFGALLIGLIGALLAGAINRTLVKLAQAAETGEQGNGAARGRNGALQVTWQTVACTVTSVSDENLTVETGAEGALTFSLGPADFLRAQRVTFAIGDAVRVRGFWEEGDFHVGEITRIDTGERLMLRDADGRPLWRGRGQSGRGSSSLTSWPDQERS